MTPCPLAPFLRRCPLAASRRYYPGFLAALFLVLLRIAIGWHFAYEGVWKLDAKEGKPFTAEGYFRASAGPLAPYFRLLVPDFDSLERLKRTPEGVSEVLKLDWKKDLDRYAQYYKFDSKQRDQAEAAYQAAVAEADAWFHDTPNANRLTKYEADVARVLKIERDANALPSQREVMYKDRRKLNTERTELLGTLEGWSKSLHGKWTKLATEEQLKAAGTPSQALFGVVKYDFRKFEPGELPSPMTRLDWLNTMTIYGLLAAGVCLMAGLFTRLSALYCAGVPGPDLSELAPLARPARESPGGRALHLRQQEPGRAAGLHGLRLPAHRAVDRPRRPPLRPALPPRDRARPGPGGSGRATGRRQRPLIYPRRVPWSRRHKEQPPMTTLTPEERALGRTNANIALGSTRRDFLKAAAALPAVGAFGAYYFGYDKIDRPVRAALIGTGNEGRGAMISGLKYPSNRDYIDYIGFCDIRPSNAKLALEEFKKHPQYSAKDIEKIKKKQYADADEMIADPDVEMIVIALPLWLHAPIAIKALNAGKHVFSEKLMAHSVGQCKAMCRVAREKKLLLAVGHQRHYSALYDNANYLVQSGSLGDLRHIRAQWHRNNACPQYAKNADGSIKYDEKGQPELVKDEKGNVVYFDSWKPPIPKDDLDIDFKKYGYTSLDELIRWRLYNRTGAGLMAELGSHQLDACSIFLGKQHPLAVSGIGGTYFFKDGREVDDHVFTTFEFPGPDGPSGKEKVIVTYSSINTNSFPGMPLSYGEMVMGSRGTMIVAGEEEIMLFKEVDPNTFKAGDGGPRTTTVSVENKGGKPALATSPSQAGQTGVAVPGTVDGEKPSRGYREELEHFAFCVRKLEKDQDPYAILSSNDEKQIHTLLPRCRGEVAMADAIIALTSNLAMKDNRRIVFEPAWFDYTKDDVPDASKGDLAMND